MADKIKVWFDAEADFLEVRFSDAAGYDPGTIFRIHKRLFGRPAPGSPSKSEEADANVG